MRQLLGIAPIRLHPVASLDRHQRRRDHLAQDSQLGKLPVKYIPGWTSFVTGLQPLDRPQLLHQFANRFSAVGYRSQTAHLAIRLCNRYRYRFGMDIQT